MRCDAPPLRCALACLRRAPRAAWERRSATPHGDDHRAVPEADPGRSPRRRRRRCCTRRAPGARFMALRQTPSAGPRADTTPHCAGRLSRSVVAAARSAVAWDAVPDALGVRVCDRARHHRAPGVRVRHARSSCAPARPGCRSPLNGEIADRAVRAVVRPRDGGHDRRAGAADAVRLRLRVRRLGRAARPKRTTITVPESDASLRGDLPLHRAPDGPGRRRRRRPRVRGTARATARPTARSPRAAARSTGCGCTSTTSSEATQLSLGLYADAGGTPGALLGAGSATTVQAGAWNEVELDQSAKVTAGRSVLDRPAEPGRQRGRPALARPGRRVRRRRGDGRDGDLAALPATGRPARLLRRAALGATAWRPRRRRPTWASTSSPGRLAFAATAGGAAPSPQSLVVQANNGGCGPCHWEISDDARLAVGDARRGDWPTEVSVSVDPSGLEPGIYRATVVVDRGPGIDATDDPGRAEGRRAGRAPRRRLELRRGQRLDGDPTAPVTATTARSRRAAHDGRRLRRRARVRRRARRGERARERLARR